MERNWIDFKSLHSNINGARAAFEDACESLFKVIYKNEPVGQVKVNKGDGGIDIFIGELGVKPIIVIQCKFFLESFGNSQKSQIRSSFETVIKSEKYEVKQWVLCIPRIIDIDENSWWFNWRAKQIKKHSKAQEFIKLKNGNELIDLFKEKDLYNNVFKIEDSIKIAELHEKLVGKKAQADMRKSQPNLVLFNNYRKINEPFYLFRSKDEEFFKSADITNVWIYGDSGTGKTALINRNLIQNNIEYCYCDLSPTNISKKEDVLIEILLAIEEQLGISLNSENSDEQNLLKKIPKLLCECGNKKIVIVIDELAVRNLVVLKEIAESFLTLAVHFGNLSNNNNLRFVVSTIVNPIDVLSSKTKAVDQFHFIQSNFIEEEVSNLFDLINSSLELSLSEFQSEIVKSSQESPRILKSILKKIVISGLNDSKTIRRSINSALEEAL